MSSCQPIWNVCHGQELDVSIKWYALPVNCLVTEKDQDKRNSLPRIISEAAIQKIHWDNESEQGGGGGWLRNRERGAVFLRRLPTIPNASSASPPTLSSAPSFYWAQSQSQVRPAPPCEGDLCETVHYGHPLFWQMSYVTSPSSSPPSLFSSQEHRDPRPGNDTVLYLKWLAGRC